eukprot:g801.t1
MVKSKKRTRSSKVDAVTSSDGLQKRAKKSSSSGKHRKNGVDGEHGRKTSLTAKSNGKSAKSSSLSDAASSSLSALSDDLLRRSKLTRRLGATNKADRDTGMLALKMWLRVNHSYLSRIDFLKLWKALFYTMWHADKVPVQQELAQELGSLLHCFQIKESDLVVSDGSDVASTLLGGVSKAASSKTGSTPAPGSVFLFLHCAFETLCREWSLLDRWRLNKYLSLMRCLVQETLQFAENYDYHPAIIQGFNSIYLHSLFLAKTFGNGVRFQISRCLAQEVLNPTFGKQTHFNESLTLKFLDPLLISLLRSTDLAFTNHIGKHVLSKIVPELLIVTDEDQEEEDSEVDDMNNEYKGDNSSTKVTTKKKGTTKNKKGTTSSEQTKEDEEEESSTGVRVKLLERIIGRIFSLGVDETMTTSSTNRRMMYKVHGDLKETLQEYTALAKEIGELGIFVEADEIGQASSSSDDDDDNDKEEEEEEEDNDEDMQVEEEEADDQQQLTEESNQDESDDSEIEGESEHDDELIDELRKGVTKIINAEIGSTDDEEEEDDDEENTDDVANDSDNNISKNTSEIEEGKKDKSRKKIKTKTKKKKIQSSAQHSSDADSGDDDNSSSLPPTSSPTSPPPPPPEEESDKRRKRREHIKFDLGKNRYLSYKKSVQHLKYSPEHDPTNKPKRGVLKVRSYDDTQQNVLISDDNTYNGNTNDGIDNNSRRGKTSDRSKKKKRRKKGRKYGSR